MSGHSRYIIGIDLGTTNSAAAYIDIEDGERLCIFEIPQHTGDGRVAGRPQLPSFLYLPTEYEQSSGALPWSKAMPFIVGEYARIRGALAPLSLVSSAKSWLCHSRVGRSSPILPWGRQDDGGGGGKISPVEASSRYLRHIVAAWDFVMAKGKPASKFENQQVVITIPASFDESARELTAEAAKMAGIKVFTMLEEPQAAFYSWLSCHEADWPEIIKLNKLILVFDVGGGTTDFNLIMLKEQSGRPVFQRMAVGDHLMLGGDNIDLALAKEMEGRISGGKRTLGIGGWVSLSDQCRAAKEALLSDNATAVDISILGTGRGVIGGALTGQITSDDVRRVVMEGFFQTVDKADEIHKDKRSGFQELGLPYVADTAVMKHLASFLKRHAVNEALSVDSSDGVAMVRPDMVLFNGGVFKPALIRQCAVDGLRHWFGGQTDWSLDILENDRYDHAVALGAAYYGLVKREAVQESDSGSGTQKVRISGGLGKAYYIAVQTAEPLEDDLVRAACIVPRGFEEGGQLHILEPEFHVATNTPVSFSVYCSSYRAGEKPGAIISAERDTLVELPQIKTILHYGKKAAAATLAVSLGIRLNEYGTLDVWCESKRTTHKWQLAFDVRAEAERGADCHTLDDSNIDDALRLIEDAFTGQTEVQLDGLSKALPEALGINNKAQWPLSAIRKMWDTLITLRLRRLVTPQHEARWLNLAGFLLRPGFGHPLDGFRIKELWKQFSEGITYANNGQCRSEWWIMWRRICGGLNAQQQDILYKRIAPLIMPSKKGKRTQGAEYVELWMLASSLEHLSPQTKTALGDELVNIIKKEKGRALGNHFWSLSRLGARMSFYGDIDRQVSKDTAQRWIRQCLEVSWTKPDDAAYAVTQLGRKTGDSKRDIDEALRADIVKRLQAYADSKWAVRFIRQIEEITPLDSAGESEAFGEALPIGLIVETGK
ncbi:MAG: hsp70 family protein [Candidatus Magnetominusculus sp. LBB02]|nr:hsp70 family protein [Candidatus Magnetominusculus sp. LBB02]